MTKRRGARRRALPFKRGKGTLKGNREGIKVPGWEKYSEREGCQDPTETGLLQNEAQEGITEVKKENPPIP